MKKLKLCSLILIFFTMFLLLSNTKVFATASILGQANSFISARQNGEGGLDISKIKASVNNLLAIATDIGVVVAIGVGIYLGVKIMLASSNEKADAKQTLFAYACGVFVTFGAVAIWRIVVGLLIK